MSAETAKKIKAYSFYGFTLTIAITMSMMYITIFMTENLLYSAALMGTTLLIARLIDFVVGLIHGGIVEKARMKWGKYVSWVVLLKWVVFGGCVLLFTDISALPTVPKMIITILGYCMLNCSMNFLQTSQFGILAAISGTDMDERNKLSIRYGQGTALAQIISSAATLPLINFLTPILGNTNAYTVAALVFALPYLIGATLLTKVAAPYDPPQPKDAKNAMPAPTVGEMIKSVIDNKQLLVYVSANTLFFTGMQLFSGVQAYYFMYVLGNYMLMSVAMTSSMVFALVGSVIGPKIGLKLGKKRAMVAGILLYTTGSLCITFFAKSSLIVYIAFTCVNSLGMYFFFPFMANYTIDCGEYGYYTSGKDNRAVAMGTMSMPMKIGMMLGGALAGYGLSLIGYTAGMTPTPEFINNFMYLLGGLPSVFYILAALVMGLGYKITDADAAMYAKANAERTAKLMEEMQQEA